MSELEKISIKVARTDAELEMAKSKLAEAEAAGDETKIAKYEEAVIRKEKLLTQQLEKENRLMKASAGQDTVTGKRKINAVLTAKMTSVAPSSFGMISSDKHAWVSLYREINMKIHRPTAEYSGIHVSLMSEVLGRFCQNVKDIRLDREDNAFTLKFCSAMCGVFDLEDKRMAEGNALLATYFEDTIDRTSGKTGIWRNDGSTRVICGGDPSIKMGTAHLVYKNEVRGTHTTPEEQALASHLKLMVEAPFPMCRSVCPALLIVIAGPHMGISATVHSEGPCVDPVVTMLPLLVLKQDKDMMTQVARALKATKVCVSELRAHYEALTLTEPTEAEVNQLIFPYPRQFRCMNETVRFMYDEQIEGKLVFKAHLTDHVGEFLVGQEVIVKFTKAYCIEAHQLCFDYFESAPRLYASQELVNGWTMLVMEAVKGDIEFNSSLPIQAKERLQDLVNRLHFQNLVHGDLRANNIRVVGDRVCIIDFDWSGKAGIQRYPDFMNHQEIVWPDGARDGEFLYPEHDIEWLKRLGVPN